jgi:hypothetical protein
MLGQHPEVFMARPKEIHFFNKLKNQDSPRFVSDSLEWYLSFFQQGPVRTIRRHVATLWRHGQRYTPKVRGEATASYAVLDSDVIDEIVALNPEVRVIMSLRNPVDRAWSHAKKDLSRNRSRSLDDIRSDEFREFFDRPYQRRCAQYESCIERWSTRLQSENLLICQFEDIVQRPLELLLDICRFIRVRADPHVFGKATQNVTNATEQREIPLHHRMYLENLLADELEAWRIQST